MPKRLAIFVTHPIQYFAPIWRALAATPGLEVVVHFFSDHSVRGGLDPDFGVNVAWDVPLLEGYQHTFLRRDADLSRPASIGISDLTGLLTEGRFDAAMIHGYTHRFERQVVMAAHRLGIKTILRGEFIDVEPFEGRSWMKGLVRTAYLKWFYRYIDAFCYIGSQAKSHLSRRVSTEKLFFSPYSVDTALLEKQKQTFDRQTCRKEIGIADGQQAILFSGKLIPRKAPLLLIEAVRKLESRHRVTLMIVGDGPLREAVEKAGREVLGDRLIMAGFVNQAHIGRYFSAADMFVLPSEFETWGLVVNEAMQFGLPVIASEEVGCTRDLVVDGETGFTFPRSDSAALAGRISTLIDDPILAAKIARQGQARIDGYKTEKSVAGIIQAVGIEV